MKTLEERFEEKYIPEPNSGCWLWVGSTKDGKCGHRYGHIKYKGKMIGAHRISWIIHNGMIPSGLCVCHKCDTKCCVNPAHLFLGTHADNMRDSVSKGGHSDRRGERNGRAILTEKAVLEIKGLLALNFSHGEIAKQYGVARQTISGINIGQKWGHLNE